MMDTKLCMSNGDGFGAGQLKVVPPGSSNVQGLPVRHSPVLQFQNQMFRSYLAREPPGVEA